MTLSLVDEFVRREERKFTTQPTADGGRKFLFLRAKYEASFSTPLSAFSSLFDNIDGPTRQELEPKPTQKCSLVQMRRALFRKVQRIERPEVWHGLARVAVRYQLACDRQTAVNVAGIQLQAYCWLR